MGRASPSPRLLVDMESAVTEPDSTVQNHPDPEALTFRRPMIVSDIPGNLETLGAGRDPIRAMLSQASACTRHATTREAAT